MTVLELCEQFLQLFLTACFLKTVNQFLKPVSSSEKSINVADIARYSESKII